MIDRYECSKCGWYADIPDDDTALFSTQKCYICGKPLTKLKHNE